MLAARAAGHGTECSTWRTWRVSVATRPAIYRSGRLDRLALFSECTASDPQRNTRRLLSPLALKRTLGVRLPSNLVMFNKNMGAATHLPLRRMVCEVHHTKSHYEQSEWEGDRSDAYMGTRSPEATDLSSIIAS